ncbi:MAG: aminodeoxychorismate synthase component I [Anaerolineales bacterium]
MPPSLLLYDQTVKQWHTFTNPSRIIEAHTLSEVLPALDEVERAVQQGRWAAGFLAYEAAPAFDSAMTTYSPAKGLPLLWFGLFSTPTSSLTLPCVPPIPFPHFSPALSEHDYHSSLAHIKNHIAAGNTYQVNYTLRMRANLETNLPADPFAFFVPLVQAQASGYPAYIFTGRYAICSASPELFFDLQGTTLRAKPMKGTAPRGRTLPEDHTNAHWLHHSEKNRAENVMIVDMVRNDMGRIARTGSVQVPHLFEIERYPTLFQMTSTVQCETQAALPEIFTALFPCASITGAPKIRTMKIIRDLEPEPRGVYTGTIGFIAPASAVGSRRAQFNVAIRTVVVDSLSGIAEYGVGSGIVWDSDAADEYRECQLKARILTTIPPAFDLLESLLWTPEQGPLFLERHLTRLRDSAEYFDFPFDEVVIRAKLLEYTPSLPSPCKIRLVLTRTGEISIDTAPLPTPPLFPEAFAPIPPHPLPALLTATTSPTPVLSTDAALYHKTTHRKVYERARAACPGMDEVLLWNERGEITEFTTSNVVVEMNGQLLTPPLTCGLLAGTFRGELIEQGTVSEQVILREQVKEADAIWAINSVRGWRKVKWIVAQG